MPIKRRRRLGDRPEVADPEVHAIEESEYPKGAADKMLCGKHVRPDFVPENLRVEGCEPTSWQCYKKKFNRKMAKGEKAGSCICDYWSFPQLLKERTSLSASYKRIPATKTFPFMRLPTELRIKIYETALVYNEAIEFCPEPFEYDRTTYDTYKMTVFQHEDWADVNLIPFVRLMRANKKVHEEASSIFYGQNEFRFTNVTGWNTLDRFFYQIGLEKCRMIRNLTVCHPVMQILPKTHGAADKFKLGTRANAVSWHSMDKMYPGFMMRWWEGYRKGKDVKLVLHKMPKLRQLQFIFFRSNEGKSFQNWNSFGGGEASVVVDPRKTSPDLQISFICLESTRTRENDETNGLNGLEQLRGIAMEAGSEAKKVVECFAVGVDENGRYPKFSQKGIRDI